MKPRHSPLAAKALVYALVSSLLALASGLAADEHPRVADGDQPPRAEQGTEASPAAAIAATVWAPTPIPAAVLGSSPFPRMFYSAADALQGCDEEPGAFSSWFSGLGYDPLLNEDIIAYYGKPGARVMGILGRMDKDALAKALASLSAEYDARNGERTARSGFYLIYGTVWPGGDIGILGEATTREWVEFALSKGIIVFLDHQIGKYSVEAAVKRLLPWLAYPNVHLALDPEWRTERPMEEIGSVKGEELNAAQALIQDYMVERGLPGKRMLVVHQFKPRIISNRDSVRADFDRVLLVHTADGFGQPAVKLEAYRQNARGTNIPVKGYKLFYKSGYQGAGYDDPLMSPEQVMALDPRPALIMYQ